MITREVLTRDPECNQSILNNGIQHRFTASAVDSDVGKPELMNSMHQFGGFGPVSAADALSSMHYILKLNHTWQA